MSKFNIIAEIGVNHNGSLKRAKKLIDISKLSGANYVKFQMFSVKDHILENVKMAKYQMRNLKQNISQYKMSQKYEFSFDYFLELKKYSKKKNIIFLASVFDLISFKNYKKLNKNHIKIPSGELTNYELLNEISKYKYKVFLSTGMSTIQEIDSAINLLKKRKKIKNIIVMQCTTEYPCSHKNVNLNNLKLYNKKFNCELGFSDHTIGNDSAIIASAMGANTFEKHITLNKNMRGPDHKASCNPIEFKKYVESISQSKIILGSMNKKPTKSELITKRLVRKSIVAKKKILKNDIFTPQNITVKRPEKGISAKHYLKILGKKSKFNFKKNEKIKI